MGQGKQNPFLGWGLGEERALGGDLIRTHLSVFAALQKVGCADAHGSMVQDTGVDHGCFDLLVPQNVLDCAKVMSSLH